MFDGEQALVSRHHQPGSGCNVHRRRLGRGHRVRHSWLRRGELQFGLHWVRGAVFQGGGWSQVAGAAARRRLAGAGSGVDGGDAYRLHERGPVEGGRAQGPARKGDDQDPVRSVPAVHRAGAGSPGPRHLGDRVRGGEARLRRRLRSPAGEGGLLWRSRGQSVVQAAGHRRRARLGRGALRGAPRQQPGPGGASVLHPAPEAAPAAAVPGAQGAGH